MQAVLAIRMAAGGDAPRDALAGVATIAAAGLLIALSAPRVGAERPIFGGGRLQAGPPIDRWDQPMARRRAVAYGVPILRSSNRAPIGWIDANGRVRAESERFGRRVECHTVWSPAAAPTLHARIAPVSAWLPALVLLGLVGIAHRRRTIPPTSTPNRRHS